MITTPDTITESEHIIYTLDYNSVQQSPENISKPYTKINRVTTPISMFNLHHDIFFYLYDILPLFEANKNNNAILSGGTFINNKDTIFDTKVDLYQGEYKIQSQITNDGRFNFKYLNPSYIYDVKATPLNTDFNPRIVSNLKPVIDNSSFKFLFYCHYDKIYNSGNHYIIRTVTYDTRGILKYNIDNPPTGMTIDENTGVISFNISTIGVYNFTVNCSDSLLELTKSIPMEIEIV